MKPLYIILITALVCICATVLIVQAFRPKQKTGDKYFDLSMALYDSIIQRSDRHKTEIIQAYQSQITDLQKEDSVLKQRTVINTKKREAIITNVGNMDHNELVSAVEAYGQR